MSEVILEEGQVILAIVKDPRGIQCLLAKHVPDCAAACDAIMHIEPQYTLDSNILWLDVTKPSEAQIAVGAKFGISVLSAVYKSCAPFMSSRPSSSEIRKLIDELSTFFSGKTFTEHDFDNIVHQEVLNRADDNRNQDEIYNDARHAIIFFFTYGFLQEIFEGTDGKPDINKNLLWYDKSPLGLIVHETASEYSRKPV